MSFRVADLVGARVGASVRRARRSDSQPLTPEAFQPAAADPKPSLFSLPVRRKAGGVRRAMLPVRRAACGVRVA